MNAHRRQLRKVNNQKGFTLIELIVIITIIGILSYIAVANFSDSNSQVQYGTLIRKIATDVRFAQQLALTEGRSTHVYIDQANNRYYLKWDDGTYIQNPVGGGDFIVQLGVGEFSAVQITGTEFVNGRLDFSTSGIPLNAGSVFSGELYLVTLNNAKRLQVTANTGFLKIEDL
ncbi:MAG: prepilin-type N-terminal cleavage/methylation domain-containing protein [bacterium]